MAYIKTDDFIRIALDNNCDPAKITKYIRENIKPGYHMYACTHRLGHLRAKGLLPLDSGNAVSTGEVLKGTSTLFDSDGSVKLQWVKTDVDATAQLAAITTAIEELVASITPLKPTTVPAPVIADLATVYISNDVHLGALCWEPESGEDYNLDIGVARLKAAYDHLFETSMPSQIGIVLDLGDLMEADNDKNMTPKSGNILAVDSRYPKVLRAAYTALIYAIQKALTKHQLVYFYNVQGNHDITSAHAIREIIRAFFTNEPRVIIDDSPSPIKYHQHGATLLQFAHGDAMKMKDCGEVMAADCQSIFSQTTHRFSHIGHFHTDSVYDGRLCRVESHRNLAPLNHWAHSMGYRRNPGTMKAITYSATDGEISRSIYNVK